MKTIKQEVHLNAKPEEVYEAYTDAEKHGEFTGSKVVFEKKVGGKFSAWDGSLDGENLELVNGKKIVQKWRADDWPKGHYSTLTIELFPDAPSPVILGNEVTPESNKKDSGQDFDRESQTESAGMTKGNKGTRLILTQENVPDDKASDIDDGWHQYYWEPMREYFKNRKLNE